MKLPRLIDKFFEPIAFQSLDVSALMMALNDPAVRQHWLRNVLLELKEINIAVDRALERPEPSLRLLELGARRRQIMSVLQQIETSKNSVELDDDQNQMVDVDRLAVAPAPGK